MFPTFPEHLICIKGCAGIWRKAVTVERWRREAIMVNKHFNCNISDYGTSSAREKKALSSGK